MTKQRSFRLSKQQLKTASSFFKYIKPYKGYFLAGFLFLVLGSLIATLFPFFMGKLLGNSDSSILTQSPINDYFGNKSGILAALIGVFVLQAIFAFFRVYLFGIVTENVLTDLRQKAFKKMVMSPLSYYNKNKVGELTSRIATDINLLEETLNTTIAELIRQIIIVTVSVILLLVFTPKLSLVMLLTIPVVTIGAIIFGSFIKKLSKKTQDFAAESNNILSEALMGITNVKSFTNELFEINRYNKSTLNIKKNALKGIKWRGIFISFIILAMFSTIVFVIWRGVVMVENKELSTDLFYQFIFFTIFVGSGIGTIPNLLASVQKALGATDSLMKIIEMESEDIDISKTINTSINGEVRFDNVSFFYETRPEVKVLESISFDVKKGEKVALVGSSGAGKTSIASLILRFYEPTEGTIYVDNKKSTEYNLTELRSKMAIVPQDVMLFNGTIKENILYGNLNASDEELIQASIDANAHDFISSFPDGYNTLVGDRGIQLSGGQRQRVAIARAILNNPSILILDEATSSLDSESEKLVQEALDRLMTNRTSIVIAHRLSTIRDFDKILVFDKGKLMEQGTHDILIEKENGIYQRLAALQFV